MKHCLLERKHGLLQAFSKPQKKLLRRPGSPHSKQRIPLPADDQAVSTSPSVPKYRPLPFWEGSPLFESAKPAQKKHPDGQVHPTASSGYLCRQMIKRFRPPPQSRSTALSLFGKEARCLNRQSRKKTLRRPGSPHSKQRILLPADDQVVSISASVPKYRPLPFWERRKKPAV